MAHSRTTERASDRAPFVWAPKPLHRCCTTYVSATTRLCFEVLHRAICHIDIPDNIATEEDVTAAKQAILTAIANSKQDILDALGQISPVDEYSQALATFFGITDAYNPQLQPATDTEIINELETMWEDIFGTEPAPLPSES